MRATNNGRDFFFNHRHKIKNPINPNTYIGLTRFIEGVDNYDYYMPSIQVSSFEDIPEDMTTDSVPPCKYVLFRYIGNHPVEEISNPILSEIFDFINKTWTPKCNYNVFKSGCFYLEVINAELSSENYCECDILYPLPWE